MIELQVLNYILSTKDINTFNINRIGREYFPSYNKEWVYIENHYNTYGNVPDVETFLSVFEDFNLVEVAETPTYLINELVNQYKVKEMANAFNKVREKLLAGEDTKAFEIFNQLSEKLDRERVIQSVDLIKDDSRLKDYIDRVENFTKYMISTGFPELDSILGGWDVEDDLVTVVARPGKGKSWLLLKFAVAAAQQGLRVGFYSGEMTERKIGYRMDTLIGGISSNQLIRGNKTVADNYVDYMRQLPEKVKGSLNVLTPLKIGGLAGVKALEAFIKREELDILFVDQHSLLEDDKRGRSAVERAANISRDLKHLQTLVRIPIISASQQNRESVQEGVGTEHIAQSDRIGQDSTVVIFIERDKNDSSIMTLHLIKTRDTECGKKVSYKVDFNKGSFIYIPEGTIENHEGEVVIENLNQAERYTREVF